MERQKRSTPCAINIVPTSRIRRRILRGPRSTDEHLLISHPRQRNVADHTSAGLLCGTALQEETSIAKASAWACTKRTSPALYNSAVVSTQQLIAPAESMAFTHHYQQYRRHLKFVPPINCFTAKLLSPEDDQLALRSTVASNIHPTKPIHGNRHWSETLCRRAVVNIRVPKDIHAARGAVERSFRAIPVRAFGEWHLNDLVSY
jgi:hypothetical protein